MYKNTIRKYETPSLLVPSRVGDPSQNVEMVIPPAHNNNVYTPYIVTYLCKCTIQNMHVCHVAMINLYGDY